MSNSFGSWNFQNTLETDFLPVGEQKVSTDEICFLSTSKLQLGHQMPHAVCSVTIFCNFKMFFHHQPCASPSIFLSILGHVHSKSRTAYRTTQWFQDAKWVPLCQSQAAWQTTQIFCSRWSLQRTLQTFCVRQAGKHHSTKQQQKLSENSKVFCENLPVSTSTATWCSTTYCQQ